MKTTKELREQLQSMKVEGRERPWGYRALQRGPSIYITKLTMRLPLSPNQITFLDIIIGLVGCYFVFSLPGPWKLIGFAFLYLNILLDKVDGEVARYKSIFSLRGIYLDEINHLTIPSLFFVSLTYGMPSFITISPIITFWGTLAAISMPMIRISHSLASQIYAKKYIKHPELFTLPQINAETTVEMTKRKYSTLRMIFSVIHQFQEFFMIIVSFALSLVIETILFRDAIFYPLTTRLLLLYGIFLPIIFIENSIKGYFSIEKRIAQLNERFALKNK
jgi:hypothetical protein